MARQLVVHVVGARPNYMKVAPVYAALEQRENVVQRLVHTGQHYDTLLKDVFFAELPLPRPHVQLEARTPESATDELERTFADLAPDLVVVAGDVNSTLAGTVAARKRGVRVAHIESGLRSHDWSMPEEINRVITDHLAALLLTTLPSANEHLAAEHLPAERVHYVGNTMIDTLLANLDAAKTFQSDFEPGGYVLVTLHALAETLAALDEIAAIMPVIFPVHPRTKKNLGDAGRIVLTEPLPYLQFLSLEAQAAAVVTDSGGIQEETTVLGVPCFTLRANTERPETLEGTNRLISRAQLPDVPRLIGEPTPGLIPELWDGRAGERAAAAIEAAL
jgi:UDP-N-acetylglucosamine 2-epimerase (non-hydrolysing)